MSKNERRAQSPSARVFSQEALRRACVTHEDDFGDAYGFTRYETAGTVGVSDYFYFKDNGSNILAVAHLDTVAPDNQRQCHYLNTADGLVCYSRSLDDRLGAYIILDMLPRLGVNVDILLTIGEERGQSTAEYFETVKQYNWVIEFDRGGDDVVMYQYDTPGMRDLLRSAGARPGNGIFSDIGELDHLGCKAFNWGTGYQDYHTTRSHVWLAETFELVDQFLVFHEANADTWLEHVASKPFSVVPKASYGWRKSGTNSWEWDPSDDDRYASYWDDHGGSAYSEGAYADTEQPIPGEGEPGGELTEEEKAIAMQLFGYVPSVDKWDSWARDSGQKKSVHDMSDEEIALMLEENFGED